MKLFSSDRFTKPGKGVDKNEKPKPAFIRFFIVLWNKRNKLLGINFIYFLFTIPVIVLLTLAFSGVIALYDMFDASSTIGADLASNETANEFYFRSMLFFVIYFTSVPVFSSGPFYAGLMYILKSFYKEEPVFLWHDFITKARSNLSLGLKTMFTNMFAGLFIMLNAMALMVISNQNNPVYNGSLPWFMLFLMWLVTIFFAALLTMINLYLYPMMVSFNVTFKQLYKNSFVLCMVKWLPNLGIMLLEALLIGLPVFLLPTHNYIVFAFCIVTYAAITPSFTGLINIFYVWPVFKKYMIDNENADKSEKPASGENDAPAETPKPSGRFENGMWIPYDEEDLTSASVADDTEHTDGI